MLDAFRIKPFDLLPIYEEWQDGPYFNGNPKDISVEEWLNKIKEGCIKRSVPEEYWYKVAQHFMGPKARARLDELKQVIHKVHGGTYRWTWKKFRIALLNMGWEIDKDEKKTISVSAKSLGLWFTRKKDGSNANLTEEPEQEPADKESSRFSWKKSSRRGSILESAHPEAAKIDNHATPRPSARRSFTMRPEATQHLGPVKVHSESTVTCRINPPPPTRSQTTPAIEIVSPEIHSSEVDTTQAPLWLLNACSALDFITSEHPKAMSVLSAILITVGSIPAIPAISAGAGGAVLASGAAHAVGAIAVGLGQALSMSVKNQTQIQGNSNVITHQK